jgi:hypothetical protein
MTQFIGFCGRIGLQCSTRNPYPTQPRPHDIVENKQLPLRVSHFYIMKCMVSPKMKDVQRHLEHDLVHLTDCVVTPKANGREAFLFAYTDGLGVFLRDGTIIKRTWVHPSCFYVSPAHFVPFLYKNSCSRPCPPCVPPVPCLLEGELITIRDSEHVFVAYDCVASPTSNYTRSFICTLDPKCIVLGAIRNTTRRGDCIGTTLTSLL